MSNPLADLGPPAARDRPGGGGVIRAWPWLWLAAAMAAYCWQFADLVRPALGALLR
jgi:hypothetical protein